MPKNRIAWSLAVIASLLLALAAAFMWKRHLQSAALDRTFAKIAALDAGTQHKVCAHRSNNIAMYREALRHFDCIEMDIHVEPSGGGPPAVYHPPAENNHGLTLDFLLSHEPLPEGNLWLDVKDLSQNNWARFLDGLVKRIPPQRRPDVIVETVWSDAGVSQAATGFRDRGFAFSYYLPTEAAIACGSTHSQSCDALREQVLRSVSMGFSHLSFDVRGYPFVKSIRGQMPPAVRLLTWDLFKTWPRPDVIAAVQVYIINFPSRHSDAHN